jgi:hypothetical protein
MSGPNRRKSALSVSQRATLAVEILPRLEQEARERQRQAGQERGRGKPGSGKLGAKLPQAVGRSAEHAARLVNVSARTVKTAKALKKSDAGLYSAVIRSCCTEWRLRRTSSLALAYVLGIIVRFGKPFPGPGDPSRKF